MKLSCRFVKLFLVTALIISGHLLGGCTDQLGVATDASSVNVKFDSYTTVDLRPNEAIVVVSVGQDDKSRLRPCIEQFIREEKPQLQVIPVEDFPNSIFRWNGKDISQLQQIMKRPSAVDEVSTNNVRYVVTVTSHTTMTDCGNYLNCTERSTLSATVWDTETGKKVGGGHADSRGTAVFPGMVVMFIVPLWFDPDTEDLACRELGRALGDYFSAAKGSPDAQ